MSSVSDGPSEALPQLTVQLIHATQALAAAQTQTEVLTAVLEPALRALGAIAGAVLLVDEQGQSLRMARHIGYDPGTLTIWQDGPLDHRVPAADVLWLGHALYFEHAGALKASYPDLEERTGAVAAVATAVLPMFLDGHPLGSLVLDFHEPHAFTAGEKYFLRTLAAQCTIALDRAGHLGLLGQRFEARGRKIIEDARAQEAFVAFTEAVGSEIDQTTLIRQAIRVLQGRFPEASIGYYEEENQLWKARVWSEDISPELIRVLVAGVPETPVIRQVLRTRQPDFREGRKATQAGVDLSEAYPAAANYPLIVGGEVRSLLSIGLRNTRVWSEADRGLVMAVGRGLNLALERTRTARELMAQNAQLQARTEALEAFADLTRDLALTTDPRLLIRRAQEVVMSLLPEGAVMFYEVEGERWFSRVQHGSLNSPELQAVIDRGLPYAETSNLYLPWTTGHPYYQDHYAQDTDDLAPHLIAHIGTTAALPVRVGGRPLGVLAIVLFQRRTWSTVDRVVLETAVQSLELALERATQARGLEEERAALEAFTRFTEAVGSETDVQLLVQQAITLLVDICGGDAAYFERNGDLFKLTVWNPQADPTLPPLLQDGFLLQDSGIARVLLQNAAAFIDHWKDTGVLIPETGVYQAVAGHPYFVDGQLQSVLMMGSFTAPIWAERDKRIFRAVGRSLELALDRAQQTRTLEEERTALEAFTRFTEQVGSETDVQALVRQAISLLEDTCGVDVVYLEREGDLYKATAWNPLFNPTFLWRLQNGFPLKRSSLALMLRENTPAFVDHWADHQAAAGMVIEESLYLQAVAGYPLFQEEEMQSVLLMASRLSATWTEREKRIFRAVGRSLDLALDRAQQTRTVMAQRDALDARTQELAASTQELEAFSYSVSHDLRTPVRHMMGFLKLARTSLDGRLDQRSARYLDVVEQAGGQMNILIDALLNLSNAAQQSLRPQLVDLNDLMAQLQASLIPDLMARNIRWEVASLPAVQGDWDALKQVLTQLTENALKFTRTRDPAIIRVWAEEQDSSWKVSVGDNGLGFDPRYQDRLFNLFQRLHSTQEASGTGVGLAQVRRLILKHGGQVFAEGHMGQGATFGFILPKRSLPRS